MLVPVLVLGRTIEIPDCVRRAGATEYTVEAGDTLEKIAAAHDTTVAELRRLNRIDGSLIRVDERRYPVAPRPGPSRVAGMSSSTMSPMNPAKTNP